MNEDKEISETFSQVFAHLQAQSERQNADEIDTMLREFSGFPSPRQFSDVVSLRHDILVSDAVAVMLRKFGYADADWRAKTVFTEYTFLKRHISSLISRFEGSSYSVDKTSSLLNLHVGAILSGEEDNERQRTFEHLSKKPQWNIPRPASLSAWFDLADNLLLLAIGQPVYEKLAENVKQLEKLYSRLRD